MTGFGFASGLPLPLSGLTLRQWMTEGHATLVVIGLTGSLGLSYSLKFLWAPLLDRLPPAPFRRLGRRRGWLALVQPLLLAAMTAFACSNPASHLAATLAVAGLIALLSATQDTAIDAWRIETFPPEQQGVALAAYIWGYRIALLVGGASVIALATPLGWHGALLVAVGCGLIGPLLSLLAPEPERGAGRGAQAGVVAVFTDAIGQFLARPGARAILAYVALFKLGEAMAYVMLTPFYHSLGFNRAAVALASGPASLAASIGGYVAGSWVIRRVGLGRALIVTGFCQMAVMALYLALAVSAGNHGLLIGTAMTESFAEGVADAAFLTFLSALCAPAFTATQYALLSSLATVPLRTLGGLAGKVAATLGWSGFFGVSMAACLPAMLIMLWLVARRPQALLPQT